MLKSLNQQVARIKYDSEWHEAVFKSTKSEETPPKRKHLRNLILRSWKVRGANDFFRELSQSSRPVLTKVIVAHKTLICVHNLIQEGHPACLVDADRQRHLLESFVSNYSQTRVAYAQIVTQYARYLLLKLDFHRERPEWICDKEGAFDYEYFLERHPNGGSLEYVLAVSAAMQHLLGECGTLMHFVVQGVQMDNSRQHKEGVNACVAHPLVNLVTDSHTLYDTINRLVQRGHDEWDRASDRERDGLEERVEGVERLHGALRPLYAECAATRYIAQLVAVPELGERAPHFRLPPEDVAGRERAAAEQRAREAAEQRAREEARRREALELAMQEERRRRAQEEEERRRLQQETALLMAQQQQRAADVESAQMGAYLGQVIARGRETTQRAVAELEAEAGAWREQCRELQQETGEAEDELGGLLAENEALRQALAAERRRHEQWVTSLLRRAESAAEGQVSGQLGQHERGGGGGGEGEGSAEELVQAAESLAARAGRWARADTATERAEPRLRDLAAMGSETGTLLLAARVTAWGEEEEEEGEKKTGLVWQAGEAIRELQSVLRGERDSTQELQRQLQRLAEQGRQRASADPTAGARRRAAAGERADQVRRRLESCEGRMTGLMTGVQLEAGVAALLDGSRAIVRASAALGLAGLAGGVRGEQLESGERLATALEQLCDSTAAVMTAPHNEAVWTALLEAAREVGAAALHFIRGKTALEGGYKAVNEALQRLIASVLLRQKQVADLAAAGRFAENRRDIVEQRASVHRINAQLLRKRLSTENLISHLASSF